MSSVLYRTTHSRVLKRIYKRTLQLLRKLPKDSAYRVNTEAIICYRMCVVDECGDDIKELEESLGCGKMASILLQAENEYSLAQKIIMCRAWDPLMEQPPPGQWDWPPVPS